MGLCLLAEVAYENDNAIREHLPQLLHALLVVMDSAEPIVYQHAQQVTWVPASHAGILIFVCQSMHSYG